METIQIVKEWYEDPRFKLKHMLVKGKLRTLNPFLVLCLIRRERGTVVPEDSWHGKMRNPLSLMDWRKMRQNSNRENATTMIQFESYSACLTWWLEVSLAKYQPPEFLLSLYQNDPNEFFHQFAISNYDPSNTYATKITNMRQLWKDIGKEFVNKGYKRWGPFTLTGQAPSLTFVLTPERKFVIDDPTKHGWDGLIPVIAGNLFDRTLVDKMNTSEVLPWARTLTYMTKGATAAPAPSDDKLAQLKRLRRPVSEVGLRQSKFFLPNVSLVQPPMMSLAPQDVPAPDLAHLASELAQDVHVVTSNVQHMANSVAATVAGTTPAAPPSEIHVAPIVDQPIIRPKRRRECNNRIRIASTIRGLLFSLLAFVLLYYQIFSNSI